MTENIEQDGVIVKKSPACTSARTSLQLKLRWRRLAPQKLCSDAASTAGANIDDAIDI